MADETYFKELKEYFPDCRCENEGGHELFYFPELKFSSNGKTIITRGLLCPNQHSGYETRLFLGEQVNGKGQNWRTFQILGLSWHACSLKDISKNQSYIKMLQAHLRHFK